jgi:nitronate monooxygenase
MVTHELMRRLEIDVPLILAPMAGGTSTAELAAAVSNAGGLGFLGAAYLSVEELTRAVAAVRERTSRPFGVNLFTGGWSREPQPRSERVLKVIAAVHAELGLPAPEGVPHVGEDPIERQIECVCELEVPVFSSTFGLPEPAQLEQLRRRGTFVLGTATTSTEARILATAGVDAIIAQGAEAGGHRGTFAHPVEDALVPVLELVQGCQRVTSLPIVAAGGLMSGGDIGKMLRAGASACQLGTAFLVCPESGAPRAHKDAILAASEDRTVITRVFSGRAARGIENEFVRRMRGLEGEIPAYPAQNLLTRPMRSKAAAQHRAEYLSLWAGTRAARARALPAAELVATLALELEQWTKEHEGAR